MASTAVSVTEYTLQSLWWLQWLSYVTEVARTRLREEGNKYKGFWQTLRLVYREEGHRGLYRGLATQLIRQIPNTAIMMATYEAVVYILTSYCDNNFYVEEELEEWPGTQSSGKLKVLRVLINIKLKIKDFK